MTRLLRFVGLVKGLVGRWAKAVLGDHHPIVNRFRRWNKGGNRALMAQSGPPRATRVPDLTAAKTLGANIAGFIQSGHGVGEAVAWRRIGARTMEFMRF